jgi:hypothetical protein
LFPERWGNKRRSPGKLFDAENQQTVLVALNGLKLNRVEVELFDNFEELPNKSTLTLIAELLERIAAHYWCRAVGLFVVICYTCSTYFVGGNKL